MKFRGKNYAICKIAANNKIIKKCLKLFTIKRLNSQTR